MSIFLWEPQRIGKMSRKKRCAQIYLREKQYEKIEKLVDEEHYDSFSEAVRNILDRKLDEAIDEVRAGPAGVGYPST